MNTSKKCVSLGFIYKDKYFVIVTVNLYIYSTLGILITFASERDKRIQSGI